ncbi:MAG: KEOPS complex subunit Pcc1 [Archaeoglobaceae archaeon]
MKAKIELKLSYEILLALKPEESTTLTKAKVYQSGENLTIEIFADSVSDLRAAINSWLRLIKMCSEIEVLI